MSSPSPSDPTEQYKIAFTAYDLAKSTRSVTSSYKLRWQDTLCKCQLVDVGKVELKERDMLCSMLGASLMILINLELNEGFTGASLYSAKALLIDLVSCRTKAERFTTMDFKTSLDQDFASLLEKILKNKGLRNLSLSLRDDLLKWLEDNCLQPVARLGVASRSALASSRVSLDEMKYNTRFHLALGLYERANFTQAKNLMVDYLSGLEVAAERQSDNTVPIIHTQTDFNSKLDDYRLYIDLCAGLQHLENGDRLFERATEGADGELDDFTYAALLAQDEYTYAYQLVAEKDLEAEGLALSKMGKFQLNVLKNESKAHFYYLRAVQMANSLAPVTPKGQWYNDCRKAIEDRRNRLANAEARQWENGRKPVLEALTKQLAELEALAATKTNRDLIAHEEYKPKTPGSFEVAKALSAEETKGRDQTISKINFLKAIARYHPDKNMKWRPALEAALEPDDPNARYSVLCEEITKILTSKYGAAFGKVDPSEVERCD